MRTIDRMIVAVRRVKCGGLLTVAATQYLFGLVQGYVDVAAYAAVIVLARETFGGGSDR